MIVLGIETSCDETAVAVVSGERQILANLVLSQIKEHEVFGGVVPEVAARAHLQHLTPLIRAAMADAGVEFRDLAGVAATCGPGLIGGVMVGMMAGKAIAAVHELPFLAVNHLAAHALTPRLMEDVPFPYLLLLISGGHTQLLVVEDVDCYRVLGGTMDDALGECFDKAAKLMGLPFPGGPYLERMALQCADAAAAQERFPLPRPLQGRDDCAFSFSGLKTAVRTHVERLPAGELQQADIAALAASFQIAVAETLVDRCTRAMQQFRAAYPDAAKAAFVVSGGVAANKRHPRGAGAIGQHKRYEFPCATVRLCGDNGAMIAWAGIEKLQRGLVDDLAIAARPRWPLEDLNKEAA